MRITQVLQNLKLNTQVKIKVLEKIVEIVAKKNIEKSNAKVITIVFRYRKFFNTFKTQAKWDNLKNRYFCRKCKYSAKKL